MAQTMTAASIGRVNRRFLFLALILAALSAVLVYPLLTRSSGSGGRPSIARRASTSARAALTRKDPFEKGVEKGSRRHERASEAGVIPCRHDQRGVFVSASIAVQVDF